MKSISKGSLYLVILSLLAFSISHSREAKEYDNDINYDEQKIPHYDLPKLLVTPDGKKITSINIKIANKDNILFINEARIRYHLDENGPLIGYYVKDINLSELHDYISEIPFVRKEIPREGSSLYKDRLDISSISSPQDLKLLTLSN